MNSSNLTNFLESVAETIKEKRKIDYFDLTMDLITGKMINGSIDSSYTSWRTYNNLKRVSKNDDANNGVYKIYSDIPINLEINVLDKDYAFISKKTLNIDNSGYNTLTITENNADMILVSIDCTGKTIDSSLYESIALGIVYEDDEEYTIKPEEFDYYISQQPMLYKYNGDISFYKSNIKNLQNELKNISSISSGINLFCKNYNLENVDLSRISFKKTSSSSTINFNSLLSDCSNIRKVKISIRNLNYSDYINYGKTLISGFSNMFNTCTSLTEVKLDLTRAFSVSGTSYMFSGCTSLKNIDISCLKPIDSSYYIGQITGMFSGCNNLENIYGLDSSLKIDDYYYGPYRMFYNCEKLNFDNIDTYNILKIASSGYTRYDRRNYQEMFYNCKKLKTITIPYTVRYSSSTTYNTSISNMFCSCTSLTSFTSEDSNNFGAINNFTNMFCNCTSLETINLDIDTRKATYMYSMFYGCTSLKNISFGNNVELGSNISSMFYNCPLLTNTSLNNILALCTKSTKPTGSNKTLSNLGLSLSQATTCTTLSNYQDFLNAGWTTGYESLDS